MFTYAMVTVDHKIQFIKRSELYQLLYLQYMEIVGLVAAYISTIWTVV